MFKNKLVAVMNKTVDPGKVMNALGHIAVSLGSQVGAENLELVDYEDKNNNIYPDISKIPFIVLKANSNKIKNLYQLAKENNFRFAVFTNTMTVGTWDQQLERTKETELEKLEFWGIVMWGPWQEISECTKKFSLWN